MILPDSEVLQLKHCLYWWEWFGYISTAIVGLGCIGEYVAEFTRVAKCQRRKHKVSRLSLIVLILGIAGELLSAARTSDLSGRVIADIEARAVDAEHKTEQLKQDNIKLNIELAKVRREAGQRYFTPEERDKLVNALSKYAINRVDILCKEGDTEAEKFGENFVDVFNNKELDWHPQLRCWLPTTPAMNGKGQQINLVPLGVTIWVVNPSNPAPVAKTLKTTLENLDFPFHATLAKSRDTGISDPNKYLKIVIGSR